MAICIECKNELPAEAITNVAKGDIIECPACGITLEVLSAEGDLELEVADEGK